MQHTVSFKTKSPIVQMGSLMLIELLFVSGIPLLLAANCIVESRMACLVFYSTYTRICPYVQNGASGLSE